MRRAVAWGLALAGIVALTGCGFIRWPLSAAKVGDSLNAAFGASPRLHWSAPQAASLSVLPWPSVRIGDARLDDAYGVNLLSAPAARLNLSLIDLLRGRFIPTGVVLVSPTVTIDVDRPPFARATGELAGPASVARGALAPLASLRLSNGVLRLVSARRGLDAVDRQGSGPLRRPDGRRPTALQPVRCVAEHAYHGRRRARRSGKRRQGRAEPDRIRARFAVGQTCIRRLARARRHPDAEGDLTASIPSIAALASFLDARARRRFLPPTTLHHREGQGRGRNADAGRRDTDQRRADA